MAQKPTRVENAITSPAQASKAARVLSNPNASDRARSLAAADLSNARHRNPAVNPVTTSPEATKAARTLSNPNASAQAKSLAASALVNARHHAKKV